MKILLITDEEWNDYVYGNNILTNWFKDFDAVFAHIYCSPGLPNNGICNRYYQVTDMQMVRSLLGGAKAGTVIQQPCGDIEICNSKINAQRVGIYAKLKILSLYFHTPLLMIRDAIWLLGRYNKSKLRDFVSDFNPDVVFCPRLITPKLMRLEKIVSSMTSAPFVAFTADNEASYNHYSWSVLFWLRCWMINQTFKRHVKLYHYYFMFSSEQAADYHRRYGIPASCLYKSGDFDSEFQKKSISKPIRMIYAGRLYCNRWKTLSAIGDTLKEINKDEKRIYLDVYTTEDLTFRQKKELCADKYIYVHNAITPEELSTEYRKSDIALHVESFEKSSRYDTQYSFSTKIVDLMSSTCAILAICWEKQAGFCYLKANDAAICVSCYRAIQPTIRQLVNNPEMISEYAKKAWLCGERNHKRIIIQMEISKVFNSLLTEKQTFQNVKE